MCTSDYPSRAEQERLLFDALRRARVLDAAMAIVPELQKVHEIRHIVDLRATPSSSLRTWISDALNNDDTDKSVAVICALELLQRDLDAERLENNR
jgi:hypothetical protein